MKVRDMLTIFRGLDPECEVVVPYGDGVSLVSCLIWEQPSRSTSGSRVQVVVAAEGDMPPMDSWVLTGPPGGAQCGTP